MKAYDTVVIIDLAKGEQAVDKAIADVEKIISDLSGKVNAVERWGKRLMAYSIKKRQEGFYAMFKHSIPEESVSTLRAKLRLDEMVIREMTLVEQPGFPAPVFTSSGAEDSASRAYSAPVVQEESAELQEEEVADGEKSE